jgi:hypothetical protein
MLPLSFSWLFKLARKRSVDMTASDAAGVGGFGQGFEFLAAGDYLAQIEPSSSYRTLLRSGLITC